MNPFHNLNRRALEGLAIALETGRVDAPFSPLSLDGYAPPAVRGAVAEELTRLYGMGMSRAQIAYWLQVLSEERAESQRSHDRSELVWTGEEFQGSGCRSTSVVVPELFRQAQNNVLISSYVLDFGTKGQELFRPLAERMDNNPNLEVRMFLNIQRPYKNETTEAELVRTFAEAFRNKLWIGKRLPQVFHDPRALSTEPGPKACLHAKCVIVDEAQLFVTSANFTEAAHERNLEVGVLLTDKVAARAMRSQFEALVTRGVLRRVPGL